MVHFTVYWINGGNVEMQLFGCALPCLSSSADTPCRHHWSVLASPTRSAGHSPSGASRHLSSRGSRSVPSRRYRAPIPGRPLALQSHPAVSAYWLIPAVKEHRAPVLTGPAAIREQGPAGEGGKGPVTAAATRRNIERHDLLVLQFELQPCFLFPAALCGISSVTLSPESP
jgi:hypothetical protein